MNQKKINDNKEIKQKFEELRIKGTKWVKKGRALMEYGQLDIDIANVGKKLISHNPIIKYDNEIFQVVDDLISQEEPTDLQFDVKPVYNSTSGSVVSTMMESFHPTKVVNVDEEYLYLQDYQQLESLQNKIISKNLVVDLMKSFRLNENFMGEKSPLELFETAHEAYERPIRGFNPVSSSLIPMRSSLTLSIEKLLKERSHQEKAGNNINKIKSIANQLKKSGILPNTITSWANDYQELIRDELSPAKTGQMDREEWLRIINRSTLFLQNLLSGLDTEKIRSNE